jgi:hypothetical protein
MPGQTHAAFPRHAQTEADANSRGIGHAIDEPVSHRGFKL